MERCDEELANKVLEATGWPRLPEHALDRNADDPAIAQFVAPAPSTTQQQDASQPAVPGPQQDLQPEIPSVTHFGAQADVDAATTISPSLNDMSSLHWDNDHLLDWLWMGLPDPGPEWMGDAGAFVFPALPSFGTSNVQPQILPLAPAEATGTAEGRSDGEEDDPEHVGQIAARFGSLQMAPDGKLRYFGTSTNTHLWGNSRQAKPYSDPRSVSLDGKSLLQNADLDVTVPSDLEDHLLRLYFLRHNPCHPILDEKLFWPRYLQCRQRNEHDDLYSEVLTNAM